MIPCIRCGKVPEPVFAREPALAEGLTAQPHKATVFYSHGQYGSTVFDEMGRQYLHILICDECMIKASREERIALVTPLPPHKPESTSELWLWNYEGEPE